MATTTNYAWETPDDTDLVKDGAAAIRTLGSSIDTTTKALNPSTTLGDIEYRSSTANTNTRLGIGSTGNVLTVSGGVPTWAAPAPSGMTLVARTSFSGVASQAFDNVFTSSYFNYLVIIERFWSTTAGSNMHLQMRYGGTTATGANYNGNLLHVNRSNTTITNLPQSSTNEFTLANQCGDSTQSNSLSITFTEVGQSSENPSWTGTGTIGAGSYGAAFFAGSNHLNQTYDGFLLKAGTGNITGVVSIYGLAKA